jgi:hypothetical protein
MATIKAGIVYFRYQGQGWSERYNFATGGDLQQAIDDFTPIIYGRTAFMGEGVEIIYARVFDTDSAKKAREVPLPYPLGPHKSWLTDVASKGNIADYLTEPNDPDVCVQMRFETAAGDFWQRYFRGIPDSWVDDNDLACGVGDLLIPRPNGQAEVEMGPSGNAGHKSVCQSFWSYLIRKTKYAHKTGLGQYTTANFGFILFRKVASKKTGRPFGIPAGRRPSNLVK